MIPVFLAKIKTADGIALEGIYVKPRRKSVTALVWLHGLTSRFSSGQELVKELSRRCSQNSTGYFKFNTRGHDIVARGPKKFIGTAFEKFEDCVLDIRAMINFAQKLGYKKIILAGHSTGANKALYYLYKTKDRSVKKLILAGPISDIVVDYKLFGKKETKRRLAIARHLGKKQPDGFLPQKYGIWSARRFISILTPGKPEDVFPYHNSRAGWKELKSVRTPVAVILGSRDEHLDRPAKKLVEIFRAKAKSAKSFSGIIIKGAPHGFQKKEKELAQEIIKWIKKMNRN